MFVTALLLVTLAGIARKLQMRALSDALLIGWFVIVIYGAYFIAAARTLTSIGMSLGWVLLNGALAVVIALTTWFIANWPHRSPSPR